MSNESTYNHDLRLQRVLDHAQNLENAIRDWLRDEEPYRITSEDNPARGERVDRLEVVQQPPSELSLIIGDALHNLRSALDNLAYDLARAHTGEPLPDDIAAKSEFPIFISRAMTSGEWARKIGGIHPDAQVIIEDLQPFNRLGADASDDLLAVLHNLSNIDKHRLPHLTLIVPAAASSFEPAVPGRVYVDLPWEPVTEDAIIAR
jgi:hypothetical protein